MQNQRPDAYALRPESAAKLAAATTALAALGLSFQEYVALARAAKLVESSNYLLGETEDPTDSNDDREAFEGFYDEEHSNAYDVYSHELAEARQHVVVVSTGETL